MIEIKNLTVKYDDKRVLNDFSNVFENKEVTVILGKSGVGKTSLLNAISNLVEYSGKISGANSVSYIFQEDRLIERRSAYENVLLTGEYSYQDVEKAFLSVDLLDKINAFPKMMSGGEKNRVNVIRALMKQADVLLADEPFSALDISLRIKVANLIKDYSKSNGVPAVIVTHDLYETFLIADAIIVFTEKGYYKFKLNRDLNGNLSKDDELNILNEVTKLLTV